ncbi:MAG: OmpA family protein, partial [Deltaproteobacteria bacterium]
GAGSHIPLGNAYATADVRAFVGIVFEPSIGDRDGDGLRDDVDRCPDQPEDFDLFEDADGCPDPDNDRDGILDERDSCPNVPEDRDGDHDDDGCPEGDEGDRDGDGILDRVDQCPDQPEDRDQFQDADGCPDPDNDQDGVLDTNDLCPNDAEDRDNFEDENGCPDPDNDHDRILDARDRCPNDPETYNGTEDEDGCPDQGQVVVEEGQIRILQAINFETNSARIRPDSVPIVEAVARTLIGNPQIELVQVQGHADERGDDEHNLRLTQDRAASVVQALVDRGVDHARLHSAGFGELCRAGFPPQPGQPEQNAACQHGGPAWCHSDRAWRLDRRVVFLILRTSDGPTGVRISCDEGLELIPEEDRQYHLAGHH